MSAEFSFAPDIERFTALPDPVRARIAKAKLVVLDVDGVLTDGGVYYGPDGGVTKRFNVQDGLGIEVARQSGLLRFAVITGMDKPAVAARLHDLHIDDYFPGLTDKRESCEIVRKRHGFTNEEVAFIGDDWIDIPVMTHVGVPLAVGNAQPETKAAAVYVTQAHGGNGAVREAIRLILHCKGQLEHVFAAWMKRNNT
ncbi:MAG: HAD hydrolase family protein [Deltaproteobacteria bacterium]|nr:HAD hydrolase family protein [Deltaproteobacteria bacterium]